MSHRRKHFPPVVLAISIGAAAFAMRMLFVFRVSVDSDEPQHLHVAWAWTRGLVQYRDVFDNHFPLLHMLFTPVMAVMPENSGVFLMMRLAILPIAGGCAWLVYAIGRPTLGHTRAFFAAVLFSVTPPWLHKSVEFRNDTLWVFLWLAAVAFIVARPRPAVVAAGVSLGLCILASVKALPLMLAHAIAFICQRQQVAHRTVARLISGLAIPLALVTAAMAAYGALDEMIYGTLLFNASLPVDPVRRISGAVAFAVLAPLIAWRVSRANGEHAPVAIHLPIFGLWYALLMLCFWPVLTPRDFLPLDPVGAFAIAALRVGRTWQGVVLVAAAAGSAWSARIWEPPDLARHRFVDAAVRLAAPEEYVFDLKGNAIFRRRPVYYIYDVVGRTLIDSGRLPDRAPEEIAARGCCVAFNDASHLPVRTRRFLKDHFIEARGARVCGTLARGSSVTIAVPQIYAVVAPEPSRVSIDGQPYRGPRFLHAGRHAVTAPPGHRVAVVWWRAVEGRR